MAWIAVNRGDIFLLRETGYAEGAEIAKTRPCVIIQNDEGTEKSPVTIVASITSYKGNEWKKKYPLNVFITAKETGLPNDSLVLCNQIYTVAKTRLIKFYGKMPDEKMKEIDFALIRSLDLDYFSSCLKKT